MWGFNYFFKTLFNYSTFKCNLCTQYSVVLETNLRAIMYQILDLPMLRISTFLKLTTGFQVDFTMTPLKFLDFLFIDPLEIPKIAYTDFSGKVKCEWFLNIAISRKNLEPIKFGPFSNLYIRCLHGKR